MKINGVQPPVNPQAIENTQAIGNTGAVSGFSQPADVVEISAAARLVSQINNIPDVRSDLVARVKQEIASGKYETDQKLDIAVDRLMEDLLD